MRLNYFAKSLSVMSRWIVTTLFCVSAIAFVWQGAWVADTSAMATPGATLIASKDAGDQVQDAAGDVSRRSKNLIQDTKDQVKRTANRNASRVDNATDKDNNFIERKAKRDRDRIEMRAEQDAARTERAVEKSRNAVERTVDNIKDAFRD